MSADVLYVDAGMFFFWFSEISFEGRLTSDKSVEVTARLAWLVGKHICNTKSRTPSMGW